MLKMQLWSTLTQFFYVLTSYDKDTFLSLSEEAINGMADIEKSSDEINVSGKFIRALRKSNSNLLEHLSSRLKFALHNKRLYDILLLL